MQNAQENNPYILDNLEERIRQPFFHFMKRINPTDLKSWIYFFNNLKRINDANTESDLHNIQSQIDESILIPHHIEELNKFINEKKKSYRKKINKIQLYNRTQMLKTYKQQLSNNKK